MAAVTNPTILLITPPLTQINTPYPATTVLKGFLRQHNFRVYQVDLGIELVLEILSPQFLKTLFQVIRSGPDRDHSGFSRALMLEESYLKTIEPVIRFLQGKDPTLAHLIVRDGFLPEGPRFLSIEDMDWAFGTLGIQDRARFLATQYIEDIADLVKLHISDAFGFSRYAEKLALSATDFQPIETSLQAPDSLIDMLMLKRLKMHLNRIKPDLIGFTIPFPGCLFSALKCSQFIRKHSPDAKIVIGGGYVNTELRDIKNPQLFKYVDYITLDDGELPVLQIARMFKEEAGPETLVRTFSLTNDTIAFNDNPNHTPVSFAEIGSPDYSDLELGQYLSIVEIANPMHRLWSDGSWNKLTLAHGCYWNKCAFCDTSLDYISRFETTSAKILVDRIEAIIEQTGQTGFHFVDEAAPPDVLKDLAIELLRRKRVISWWTNIRFEPRFSKDLCQLLAASGCMALSGGLETASDRLLKKMSKGVTIAQAARTTNNIQNAGIMVHAYLMFGFPTQTRQETVDSLEVVRQFYMNGLIQSSFWHHFALTQHSPIGKNPEAFDLTITGPDKGDFARNDLQYQESIEVNHDQFARGLNKAVYNYMYGIGLNYPLNEWFEFEIPSTTCNPELVSAYLAKKPKPGSEQQQLLWLGNPPEIMAHQKRDKKSSSNTCELIFHSPTEEKSIQLETILAKWLVGHLKSITPDNNQVTRIKDWQRSIKKEFDADLYSIMKPDLWDTLKSCGLLLL